MTKDKTITIKEVTLWKIGFFIVLGILLVSYLGGENTGAVVKDVAPAPSAGNVAPSAVKITPDAADPIYGDESAGITVYEFSDFQCPFCARAANGNVADLKASSYVANGEVNFAFRHFPLNSIHPDAQKASEASVCAQQQGKFWEYHDIIFANQQTLDTASLKGFAAQLGLNQAAFDACLDGGDATAKVNKDLQSATDAGGRGTPYFVVLNKDNGKTAAVSGAVPFAQIEAAIKAVQ